MRKMFVSSFLLSVIFLLFTSVSLAAESLPDFKALVKANSKSVVNITTSQTMMKSQYHGKKRSLPQLPEDSPFNEFFKRFFDGQPNMPDERQAQGLGSGFVISSDGYILTNAHVVKESDEITVKFNDRSEKPAKLIGLDERTDVALLKVDGVSDLPIVSFGNSDNVEVGEWVLAIGSPFGLEHTATQGIVSATGRSLPSDSYVPFIQTDVAVNPGNSGGPLFNTKGEVIGINSQIYSRTGGYMGLSFAIPINTALQVADQLKTSGEVKYGWLGVVIQPMDQALAQSFQLDKPAGALVSQVAENGPAFKAGIKSGDVITEYNGKPVAESASLPPMVGATPVGTKVPLKIVRQGKTKTIEVTIDSLAKLDADNPTQLASVEPKNNDVVDNKLNIVVVNLTDQLRQQLDVKDGVLVKRVEKGVASEAGIRSGDVILMLNNKEIHNAQEFSDQVSGLPQKKSIPVLIQRNKAPMFLALKA